MTTTLETNPMTVVETAKLMFGACSDGDHDRCKGHSYNAEFPTAWVGTGKERTIAERGRRLLCPCKCHNDSQLGDGTPPPLACLECNQIGGDLTDTGSCVDYEGCHERVMAFLAGHERYQALLECGRVGAAAKAENDARRRLAALDDDGEPVERKPRGEARPTSGRCEHCGEPTKGGRFVAGHDAKLKGELKRAAEAGDSLALVELLVRGWPTHTAKVDPDFLRAAELQHVEVGATWLAERVTARIGD